jgi:hypothetical protein
MQAAMSMKHVVVDGSNIATEGRDAPSLAQLDEAVRAFIDEYHPKVVTVVVDATFPNRVTPKERRVFEDAVAANELITPPAGAIGRGDAFVLQIASKAKAVILSNDSFQEFHGDHPWLFDRGRLIGGKPVPHVGWVFMERSPVRGPTSRRAVSEAKKVAKAAVKVAESAEKVAQVAETVDAEVPSPPKKRRSRRKPAEPAEAPAAGQPSTDTAVVEQEAEPAGIDPTGDGGDGRGRRSAGRSAPRSAKAVDPYNDALPFIEFVGAHPVGSEVDATVERFSSHGAYVTVGSARGYLPLRNLADPAPRSAKEVLDVGQEIRLVVVAIDPPLRGIDLAVPGVVTPTPRSATEVVEEMAEVIADAGDEAGPGTVAAAARAVADGDASKADTTGPEPGEAIKPRTTGGRTSGARSAAKAPAAKRSPEEVAAVRKAAAKKAAATRAAKRLAGTGSSSDTAETGREPRAGDSGGTIEEVDAGPTGAPASAKPTVQPSARRATGRKSSAPKSTAKKSAAEKSAAKRSAAEKSAAKRSAAEKSAAKRSAARRSAARRSAAEKSEAKKPAGRRSVSGKGTTRKSPSDSTTGKQAGGRYAAATKTVAEPPGTPGGTPDNGAAPAG